MGNRSCCVEGNRHSRSNAYCICFRVFLGQKAKTWIAIQSNADLNGCFMAVASFPTPSKLIAMLAGTHCWFPCARFLVCSSHRCWCQYNAYFEVAPEGKSLKPSYAIQRVLWGDVGQNSSEQHKNLVKTSTDSSLPPCFCESTSSEHWVN